MVVSLPNFEIMCISCRIAVSISQEFTTVFPHWVNGVLKVSHVSLTWRVFVVLLSNPNQVKHELSDHGGFLNCKGFSVVSLIGLLQQTITGYIIRHAGGQAHYYSRSGKLKQRPVTLDWLRSLCFKVPVWE